METTNQRKSIDETSLLTLSIKMLDVKSRFVIDLSVLQMLLNSINTVSINIIIIRKK